MKNILVNIDFGIDVALVRKARFFGELSFLGFQTKLLRNFDSFSFFFFFFFFFFFLNSCDIRRPKPGFCYIH